MERFDFEKDTITALSTPPGKGGIAVIRISGLKTLSILTRIIERWKESSTVRAKNKKDIKKNIKAELAFTPQIIPNRAYHSFVVSNEFRIDECMVIFFKGPRSYTGEDSAEISIHSNPYLVEEVLQLICKPEEGIRLALPGEFTYRAFKNGKMDLIQAESVNELINANSSYFAHMKFGSLEGKLSRFMNELKTELVNLGVRIETKIEFEEDQFFDEIEISQYVREPLKRLDALLSNSRFNELLNKGLNVVIVGKVNVGKSSLFNTLLMEERSIISHVPGTTRDFIKEKIYIDGLPIEITDVAGINRDTKDDIEAQGIQRSLEKMKTCDAVIFMVDVSRPLESVDHEIYELIKEKKKIIIANKKDIMSPEVWEAVSRDFESEVIETVSVREHVNIDAVINFLRAVVTQVKDSSKEADYTINQRQKQTLEELRIILSRVQDLLDAHTAQPEIIAEEIRHAVDLIGKLMGEVTPSDILNKIFSEFCVGK